MSEAPTLPRRGVAFSANQDDAPAHRALGLLQVLLIDSDQTGAASSPMEREMPAGGGSAPHVQRIDEGPTAPRSAVEFRIEGEPPPAGPALTDQRPTPHGIRSEEPSRTGRHGSTSCRHLRQPTTNRTREI